MQLLRLTSLEGRPILFNMDEIVMITGYEKFSEVRLSSRSVLGSVDVCEDVGTISNLLLGRPSLGH